uniref:Uncharacterized protein n=1 Tax=Tanacetum cinerariifolium TaxID=118510 RepID=A0A6L2L1X8_TANCI|nr:hypothetical protein [Tanacetum cinerariifolium]
MDQSQSYLTSAEHKECYDGLIKSYDLDKSLFSTYDKENSKDAEPTEGLKAKESQSGSSKGTKSQSKSFRKSVQSEEPEFEVADSDIPQDQEVNLGKDDEEPKGTVASKSTSFRLLKGTCTNYAELEYDFEECYKALSERLDWNNLEGSDYPFDLTKPRPLFMNEIIKWYRLNNSSTTISSIKDMVRNIWSPVKVTYDKHALWVTQVEVMQKHRYGYLREIEVRRANNDLYTFKEETKRSSAGCQKLPEEDQRHQARNYQTRHQEKGPYTPYQDPQGFIYVNTLGRNRLMCSDELYKFSDGTLTRLQTSLDDITKNIQMEYLP